ncbi:MAG: ArsR family transcriptional regulator [Alphaproteobacteria bacterium]|nr:ArsR family transcriptional regulator [Alphaproteobacteria bacterium]
MTNPANGLEPLFNAPTRLQITAFLSGVAEAEFAVLRDMAGVSDSVLSKQLSALSDVGLVELRKSKLDGRQRTWAALTRKGRKSFAAHVAALQQLVQMAARAAE